MILVHVLGKEDWAQLAQDAHKAIFGENKPASQERIDFALLCVDQVTDDVLTYVTCKELSADVLYWSYGGAFPPASGSVTAWLCYKAATAKSFEKGYKTIFTLIENTNKPMLKFAAKMGYKIVGLRHVDGATMLEHVLEKPC